VIEPDDGILAIGSGGPYAQAAAMALAEYADMDAGAIARRSLEIAASSLYLYQTMTLLWRSYEPDDRIALTPREESGPGETLEPG